MRNRSRILSVLVGASVLAASASAADAGPKPLAPHRTPTHWGGTAIGPAPAIAGEAQAPAPAPGDADRRKLPRTVLLSNDRTFSTWAYTSYVSPIRVQPSAGARSFARLRHYTEDGFPEVYSLLKDHFDGAGNEWVKIRVPGRPNGRTGWVRRGALATFHRTNQRLVLRRARLRIYLYVNGHLRWKAPVGIGKASTPTPAGRFWIRERFKILDRKSGYWPYAFGTADYSVLSDWPGGGVIGIHGPYGEPNRIPGRPSHGCIRLRKSDDGWLGRHIGVGTPLRII